MTLYIYHQLDARSTESLAVLNNLNDPSAWLQECPTERTRLPRLSDETAQKRTWLTGVGQTWRDPSEGKMRMEKLSLAAQVCFFPS